jgi:phosphoesterase RecJ-like protein
MSRSVEGVLAGITVKENREGEFKISLRTYDPLDASAICGKLGGGGHKAAAGCTVIGTLEEAKNRILKAVKEALEELE